MRDLSGQQIRGYKLEELIGSGGFAAVYRAYQPSVEREVAIKVILPRHANDPDFVRRFEAEAQLIARLEHIHIVPLYDYWREPDNAYLVMRWLRGGTLYDSLTRLGTWPLDETARLLEQISSALTVAHRSGVIHQDLTPANILLDTENNAYLADFGIAKDLLNLTESREEVNRPLFGSPAYMAPEQITGTYMSPQSDIYSLGIILFHMLTGQLPFDAPDHTTLIRQQMQAPMPPLQSVRSDLPTELNVIVMRAAAKNPGVRYSDAMSLSADFRRAVSVIDGVSTTTTSSSTARVTFTDELEGVENYGTLDLSAALTEPNNPYKGLRAFDEADAGYFFGRDMLIQQVCQRIADLPSNARLLTVTGPSGSGKSSLVRAGVIPGLRHGCVPGSENWFTARMMPGPYPFAELEMALLAVSFDAAEILASVLRDSSQGLATAVKQILPDDESELVLFIDQFEEVFTLVEWEKERRAFLNALAKAVTDPECRLRVVIALRADFYDRPLVYPGFGALVRANTEVVLPLTSNNLRSAIVEPARKELLEIEDAVVDAIVSEVGEEPGALPLLQYALTELFERREKRRLTLSGYRESGGVSGALARRADDVFNALLESQQHAVRQLFLRLVTLGENNVDTRRRVLISDLLSIGNIERSVMQAVLDELGRYRLLTFDHDPQTREPTVEVAHEALITRWERLRSWLEESRGNIRIQRQLAMATVEWRAARYDNSFLARGSRLAQFETLFAADDVALTQAETEYLDESLRLRRRAIWQQRMFIAGLVVITVAALIAATFAWDREQQAERARATTAAERDRADEQAHIARSRELALTALNNSDLPDRALLLSLEALRTADTYDARNSLVALLQSQPQLNTILQAHTAPLRSVAASRDGRWFATGDRTGHLIIWDAGAFERVDQVTLPERTVINALAVAPSGDRIAIGSADGIIYLWLMADLTQPPVTFMGHDDAVWDVAFSPDGALLASASADATVRLWDVESGEAVAWQGLHDDFAFAVAFSPDGAILASGGADNAVRLWDMKTPWNAETGEQGVTILQGHTNWVFDVAFSLDGATLASGGADNVVRLWDVETGEPVGEPLEGHTDWVRSVAYNVEGVLVSSSVDGTVRLWEPTTGMSEVFSGHTDAVWDVTFVRGGSTAISVGADNRINVWDINAVALRINTLYGHREAISSVAVSPDGRVIASAGGEPLGRGQDNTIRLWDADSGALVATLEGHESVVTAIAFAPDGSRLVSSSADGTVRLWSVPDGASIGVPLDDHRALLLTLAYSPDGRIFATGGSDGSLVLWDAASNEPLSTPLFGHEGGILDLAFSPDSTLLASASEDGSLRLWDMANAEPWGAPLRGHDDIVTRVIFSPDGQRLVSGSRDLTIRFWNWQTGAPVGQPLVGHERRITALAFNATGTMLASGSQDATIRLWNVAQQRAIAGPLTGHQDWVSDLAFLPSGTLVSGSWDMRVMLWATSVDLWQQQACHIAHRNLTTDEWARFMPDSPYSETCLVNEDNS